MYVMGGSCAQGDKKRLSGLVELKLKVVVYEPPDVDAGSLSLALCRRCRSS